MSSTIERIKLSKKGKDQLVKLKRITKIENWNVLCRWAFCRSLAEVHKPAPYPVPADSNLEMSWQTFGGDLADILFLLLKYRCVQDGFDTDPETLNEQFRLHLHRGIGYLVGNPNLTKLEDLLELEIKH
ncbi:DNA sulfur modification protein DndE [Geminocystis sp. CENA526]|uniref:DNA sulfur modification protein DndE n=1 Tax=Geminocystis sp. CENA526 TaxID=1355871 RepID=UPI003D6FD385